MNNKLVQYLKYQPISYALEFIAMLMVLLPNALIVSPEVLVDRWDGANLYILSRTVSFLVLVACLVTFKYVQKIGISYNLNKNPYLTSLASLSFILCSVGLCLMIFYKKSLTDKMIHELFVALGSLYLMIHIWGLFNISLLLRVKTKYLAALVASLSLFVVFLPLCSSPHINSESYPNLAEINFIKTRIVNESTLDNVFKSFLLTPDEAKVVSINIQRMRLAKREGHAGYYNFNGNTFEWESTFGNLSALCLLGDFSQNKSNTENSVVNCIDEINDDKFKSIKVLEQIKFLNHDISASIFKILATQNLNDRFTKQDNQDLKHLYVQLLRGGVLHHYNSIAQTINSANSVTDFFSNQYGLGPLAFVSIISSISGLSLFDSLFISVVIFNIAIAAILLLTMRFRSVSLTVWIGFILSIYVTYAVSNVLAPFLFFIRYLPTIIFCLYLYSRHGDQQISHKNINLLVWSFFIFAISIYNFEYALLTLSSLCVVSWYWRKWSIFALSSVGLCVAIIPKLYLPSVGNGEQNYISYIAGVGMSGTFNFITVLYIVMLVSLIVRNHKLIFAPKSNHSFEEAVLTAIIITLSFKVVWNGGGNHIGPLFLLMSLASTFNDDRGNGSIGYSIYKRTNLFLSILILLIATVSWQSYYLNNKFSGVKYTRTEISRFFSAPTTFIDKIQSFKLLYQKHDLVLSQTDNALAMFVGDSITGPFPDVSTNLNTPKDISLIVKAYVNSHQRIIVDKAIVDDSTIMNIKYNFQGINEKTDSAIQDYYSNNARFKIIYEKLKQKGYVECNENKDFVVLCSKETAKN
jgi:hypothetical protein